MKHVPTENETRVCEIFSSLQGEGTHVGERHLFIRFEECHMECDYCDELGKPAQTMTQDQVLERVEELEKSEGPHSFISLTGGEPLLYLTFLKPLMKTLKAKGFRLYLETSGVLWQALQEVIDLCDCIAMDMKTASVTKEKNYDQEHAKFLEIANAKETFVKFVVSKDIDKEEFKKQIEIIVKKNPLLSVVLMPLSSESGEGHEDPELMKILQELQTLASEELMDVRIVPRFHKILNIR